ncbi:MazG nucleotide pyrophosphohydrolase domain-containing protein [Candidatus Izimaplasma bacterium ZiA1]|uniref:MazG nucleotide pyrophosphohydrolase domain-containing protein n=1 Tax=Candidatus Izimoplasma sp. ZiA1 TaxID=2024899 RepID=UPI00143B843B
MLQKGMTLKEVQDHILKVDHHPELKLEVMLKLVEEVGELAVEVRKESINGPSDTLLTNMKHELYDVLHFVAHIANIYNINLEDAVIEKDAINAIRYKEKRR